MIRKIKKLIPQRVINYGEHLPLAVLANIVSGFPSRKLKVIGVTGTDGKTTTANMIYQILKENHKNVALVSTINAKIGDEEIDTGFHVTSPDPMLIQKIIKKAVDKKTEYLVLEVTSHALDQFRVWGIKFDIGVITNITAEHLDYHKNMENYINAKAKLIKSSKWAVLNKDDKNFDRLKKVAKGKVLSFGLNSDADVNLKKYNIKLQLKGDFNLLNGLAAASVGQILGLEKDQIIKPLEEVKSLVGRMQEVENKLGIKIVIDFAHTPNALKNALETLKKDKKGKLISVFGAASERDVEKRPKMGEIAGRLGDVVILTEEDPRFEDNQKIMDQIAKGVLENKDFSEKNLFMISDRKEAIKKALEVAKKGDTVGIFGKGHERSINRKGVENKWSDYEAVEGLIKNS